MLPQKHLPGIVCRKIKDSDTPYFLQQIKNPGQANIAVSPWFVTCVFALSCCNYWMVAFYQKVSTWTYGVI